MTALTIHIFLLYYYLCFIPFSYPIYLVFFHSMKSLMLALMMYIYVTNTACWVSQWYFLLSFLDNIRMQQPVRIILIKNIVYVLLFSKRMHIPKSICPPFQSTDSILLLYWILFFYLYDVELCLASIHYQYSHITIESEPTSLNFLHVNQVLIMWAKWILLI